MQIIDIHTHIYPEKIALKATQSVRDFYELEGSVQMTGTVDMLLKRGAEAGISRFVVLPVSNTPNHVRSINEFIVSQVQQQEKFIGFGTVHAQMQDLSGETEWILDQGLKGIKMHPDSQRFNIDDPDLFPMYDMVQGKIPVMLHMGDQRYDFSHPVRLRRVMELFPRLEVIAAHFGGYSMFETAKEQLSDKNCIFDISSAMMFMEPGEAEKYINHYGAERLAYGTDYPLWDPVEEVNRFLRLKLTDSQFEQIAHKTAEEFLKL